MAYFLVFEVFISAECVYRMYLTYFLSNLSNKRILSFFIFGMYYINQFKKKRFSNLHISVAPQKFP